MRVCIYTAIAGGYDILKKPAVQVMPTDFYCFTDGVSAGLGIKNRFLEITRNSPKLGWGKWDILVDSTIKECNSRMWAKWYKLHPHKLFPSSLCQNYYDYTIWVDGSAEINSPNFSELVVNSIKSCDRACYKHPVRDCIYEECVESVKMLKYKSQPLKDQVDFYKSCGYPVRNGLMACGVIGRRSSSKQNIVIDEKWWLEINKWSIQDQLSLPYILWSENASCDIIPGELYNNDYVKFMRHQRKT